ncbi:MAG: hypothetical protein IKN17_02060 [Ruminococcus sp.]|nr:hypothetical protein [Ruminococcus sp.]
MNTYVFFTKRIAEIGGAEQYIYNKMTYLKKQGWRVLIFSGRDGNIMIEDFKPYRKYCFQELRNAPVCCSKRAANRVINKIAGIISSCPLDECIIESESVIRAAWAELVAEKLRCKHFAFPLQEEFFSTRETKAFLRFKYRRHELAGIAVGSVGLMLDDPNVKQRPDTKFSAYCNNVFDDCIDVFSSQLDEDADYTIGSIGRLEKPCVIPLLEGIKEYIVQNSDKKFNLVVIGGQGTDSKISAIKEMFEGLKNTKLIMTGDMYPIPNSLVDKIDVFVSTAGSASATFKFGKPTVKVNPVTGVPAGIMGYDFIPGKDMYSRNENASIPDHLKKVLVDKVGIDYCQKLDDSFYRIMYAEFDRQLNIARRDSGKDYFSKRILLSMYPRTKSLKKTKLVAFTGKILGAKTTNKLLDYAEKRLKK